MDDRLAAAVHRLFAPADSPARQRRGRIGAELEMFVSRPLALADPAFRDLARPTLEPGGQLELSPGPQASMGALVEVVERCLARVHDEADGAGASIDLCGTRPTRVRVPLRLRTPRYLAMQDLFDRVGPDGRRMMRSTDSLQVCVDLLPGVGGTEQWLVANLAGPPLAAAFANSPHLDGRLTTRPGNRTAIWCGVDLSRTGYDGRHLDADDPVRAYLAFAARAARLPIPEAADAAYHLTTLFPPVRPRGGYLEVRYLDAQPRHRIGEVIGIVATLLQESTARREALELLRPRLGDEPRLWAEAAEGRSADAADLLAIVARRQAVAA